MKENATGIHNSNSDICVFLCSKFYSNASPQQESFVFKTCFMPQEAIDLGHLVCMLVAVSQKLFDHFRSGLATTGTDLWQYLLVPAAWLKDTEIMTQLMT